MSFLERSILFITAYAPGTTSLNYSNTVRYGNIVEGTLKLQQVQNITHRYLLVASKVENMTPVLTKLLWLWTDLPVKQDVIFILYEFLHGLALTVYLKEQLPPYIASQELWPHCSSFVYCALQLWDFWILFLRSSASLVSKINRNHISLL